MANPQLPFEQYLSKLTSTETQHTELALAFGQLYLMALDGDKDAAIFILTKFPEMPTSMKDTISLASKNRGSGRKVETKSDAIWLTIEIAKFSGRSIQQGIEDCAELYQMDEESVKKAWDRAHRRNSVFGDQFAKFLICTSLNDKMA
jgi:hypothetical protein